MTPPVESRAGDRGLAARFPLEMISPKNGDSMNSTFGYRPEVDAQTAVLTLHPADAAPRAIATGDAVRIFNDRGQCVLRASVADTVAEGVVCAPFRALAEACAGRKHRQHADFPAPDRQRRRARRSIVV